MEFCPYCKVDSYESYCICSKTGNICVFVRRKPCIMQWSPLESMVNCKLRQEEVVMFDNEKKVRFVKNNKLFVEVDDFVIEVLNPYDYEPNVVELVEVDGVYYVKGFEPKKETKKTKYTKETIEDDEEK